MIFFDSMSGLVTHTSDMTWAECSRPADEAYHVSKRLCRRSSPCRSSSSDLQTTPSNSSRLTDEIQNTLVSSSQGTSLTSFTPEQTLNCASFHDHLTTISAQDSSNPNYDNSPGADVAYPATPLLNDDHEAEASTLVCFGMLSDVKAQIQLNPDTVSRPVEDRVIRFDVAQSKEYFSLRDLDRVVAFINLRTCEGLARLKHLDVQFEAFVDADTWVNKIGVWKKQSKAAVLPVDIVLYGHEERGDEAGELLSDAKLYLQLPKYGQVKRGVSVVNPHWLELDVPAEEGDHDMDVNSNSREDQSVDALFRATPQLNLLQRADIDPRVEPLYDHQRIAVDFILKKEQGNLPASLNLWQPSQNRKGMSFFSHVLIPNQQRASAPDECEGGILADDMGCGKTATMLAVIAATLNKSKKYVETNNSTSSERCSATLVVAPSPLILDGWEAEIRRCITSDLLKVHKYHGPGKEIDLKRLAAFDIVLTTYATIEHDARPKGYQFFLGVDWYRIVLDEAHVIRTCTTKQYAAVHNIRAKFRWCLTGTPMQNKLEDFGALVRFVRIPLLEDRSVFRKCIIDPQYQMSIDTTNLRHLLGSLCLRRRRDVVNLPEPITRERRLQLSEDEKSRYAEVLTACREAIAVAHRRRCYGEIRRATLREWLRLRMACNNGGFEKPPPSFANDPCALPEVSEAEMQTHTSACPSCSTTASSSNSTQDQSICPQCVARLCRNCLPAYFTSNALSCSTKSRQCHVCRKSFTPHVYEGAALNTHFESLTDEEIDRCQSTKLNAVVKDITEHQGVCNSLVFSVWKTTLDLLKRLLARHSIAAKFMHGGTSISERRKTLNSFQREAKGGVLLMTLGTGAEGLNLFNASRIHVIEPQWNPAVESQAIGRAVRLGQVKEVTVIKYVMEGTVETESVQENQKYKLKLAQGFQNSDHDGNLGQAS